MSFIHEKIASVLTNFAREHGVPNAISPSELAQLMNAPSQDGCRLMLGRMFRSERIGLNRELEPSGLAVTGYGRSRDGSHMVASIDAISSS